MLFGLEAAGGAAVAGERFDGVVECPLHLGVELLVFQPFAGQPFGGGHQRRLALQVAHIGFARLQALAAFLQGDHGLQHVEGGGTVVAAVQQGQGGVYLSAGAGGLGQPGGG